MSGGCFSQHGNGSAFGMMKSQTFLSFSMLQNRIRQRTVRSEPTFDTVLQNNEVLARKHKLWEKETLREGVPDPGKAARHCGHFPSHLQAGKEEEAQGEVMHSLQLILQC